MTRDFKITTEEYDTLTILHILGNCTLEVEKILQIKLQEELDKNPEIIGVDLSEVNFVSSCSISSFVKFFHLGSLSDITVVFYNLTENIKRSLSNKEFDSIIDITTEEKFKAEYLKVTASR